MEVLLLLILLLLNIASSRGVGGGTRWRAGWGTGWESTPHPSRHGVPPSSRPTPRRDLRQSRQTPPERPPRSPHINPPRNLTSQPARWNHQKSWSLSTSTRIIVPSSKSTTIFPSAWGGPSPRRMVTISANKDINTSPSANSYLSYQI